jgi:uncharacterized protein
MRPALRQGDYGAALAEAARQIADRVAAGKGVQVGAKAPRRAGPPLRERTPWLQFLGSALFIAFILWTLGRSSRRAGYGRSGASDILTGMLIGNLLGGAGRSHRGGGGFGGYDSGDSFGGFGGGDSGGGGASSDW